MGVVLLPLVKKYSHSYRWILIVVLVFQFLQTIGTLYLPTINAQIIDNGIIPQDKQYILRFGLLMLIISITQVIFTTAAIYFSAKVSMGFGAKLRGALYQKIISFSKQDIDTFSIPSLITRNTNDVQQVQMLFLSACTTLVAAPMMLIGGLIMSLKQDVTLAWVIAASILCMVIILYILLSKMVPLSKTMQDRIDKVNSVVREQILGIRVVRAFVRENFEKKRFETASLALTNTVLNFGKINALIFPLVMLVVNLASVVVLWFGASRIEAEKMEIGSLTVFLSYLVQMLMAVLMSTFLLIMLPRALVSAKRIKQVLETSPSSPNIKNSSTSGKNKKLFEVTGSLSLQNVTFFYPNTLKPALCDINFSVEAGQKIAIVGSTGSGKTTLINLIPQLLEPKTGTLLLDNIDFKTLDNHFLRKQIGLVPQKSYLFQGNIASNLRYGNWEATEHQMWEALEVAQAKSFVEKLENQLYAPISQGGTNLSGGQRQRIAIARALLLKPKIFIFDDSFSALDLLTEAKLHKALQKHVPNITSLTVAQRVSTVMGMDKILVLEQGKVVGWGNHKQLLQNCVQYCEIVSSQLDVNQDI